MGNVCSKRKFKYASVYVLQLLEAGSGAALVVPCSGPLEYTSQSWSQMWQQTRCAARYFCSSTLLFILLPCRCTISDPMHLEVQLHHTNICLALSPWMRQFACTVLMQFVTHDQHNLIAG